MRWPTDTQLDNLTIQDTSQQAIRLLTNMEFYHILILIFFNYKILKGKGQNKMVVLHFSFLPEKKGYFNH